MMGSESDSYMVHFNLEIQGLKGSVLIWNLWTRYPMYNGKQGQDNHNPFFLFQRKEWETHKSHCSITILKSSCKDEWRWIILRVLFLFSLVIPSIVLLAVSSTLWKIVSFLWTSLAPSKLALENMFPWKDWATFSACFQ